MEDILGLSTRPKNDDTKRIKKLVRDAWTVPEEVVIMVSELRCHDEDCPDVETVIALMAGPGEPVKVKIGKPMGELNFEMIASHRPVWLLLQVMLVIANVKNAFPIIACRFNGG